MKKIQPILIAITFGLLLPFGLFSQPSNFIPPALPEKAHAPTPYSMATLSTAMIECPALGTTITAIAHSDLEKTYVFVELGDGLSSVGPIVVANARWAAVDVALADDPVFPGSIYRLAVTYRNTDIVNNNFDQWMMHYEIKLEPLVPAISMQFKQQLSLGTIPFGAGNLRVDAVPSLATVSGAIPLIDRFMVLYSDANDNLNIRTVQSNDILLPLSDFGPYVGYAGKDIAAHIETGSGKTMASVAVRPTGGIPTNLSYLEVNMTGPTGVIVPGTPYPLFPGDALEPRIEAFGYYHPGAGFAKWAVVGSEEQQKIMLYTDLSGGGGYHCNPSQYNPGDGTTQEYPTIAAGIGPAWGSNIGNEQFGYAWGFPNQKLYLAQALDVSGNAINPNDAYIVNNTPCNMPVDPSDIISMSNSCNTGYGTVVAWNEGDRILYKLMDNAYQFRPTAIGNIKSLPAFEMFPNPAGNLVSVKSATPIVKITILNSIGMQVYQGGFNSEQVDIDLSHMAPGIYHVSIMGKGGQSKAQRLTVMR